MAIILLCSAIGRGDRCCSNIMYTFCKYGKQYILLTNGWLWFTVVRVENTIRYILLQTVNFLISVYYYSYKPL